MSAAQLSSDLKVKTENEAKMIISTELAYVLHYKFPKAQYHFLVIPKSADLTNIFDFTLKHLAILEHMLQLAIKAIALHKQNSQKFMIGFKRDSDLNTAQMHVISNDFISISLASSKHWNSFHTTIFLPYRVVFVLLKLNRRIKPLTPTEFQDALGEKLKCNQCDFVTDEIVHLKIHLMQHWNEKSKKKSKKKIQAAIALEKAIKMLDVKYSQEELELRFETAKAEMIKQNRKIDKIEMLPP